MIQHAHIIKKIYFPRLIIPASALLVALFEFGMAFVVFVVLVLAYGLSFHLSALLLIPAALLMILTASFGLGALLAALNLKYRDFRYALPFLLQVLFFASGIIYPLQAVGTRSLQYVLALNPVNGAIELLRASLTGSEPDAVLVALGCLTSILLTFTGITYFRRTENYFADIA